METQEQITYRVPVINMPWLMDRVEKLNKKADKLGTPAIVFSVIRSYNKLTKDANGREYVKPMNEIAISGIAPKLAGWSFQGTIQHTENGNILRAINETAIPEAYRSVKRLCDHCNKDRNRKDTYLVVNENNEFKQLGKSCLKDYTGHISPAHLAMLAEFIDQLNNADQNEYPSSGHYPLEVFTGEFLRMCCESVVAHGGFVTRKQAELGTETATANRAWMSLFPPRMTSTFVPLSHTTAGAELYDKVVSALVDLEQKKDISAFEHNILMVWKQGVVTNRETGLFAAAILIYERALVKKLNLALDQESNWVGTVKDRTEFTLTVSKKMSYDSAFGFVTIILMKDSVGNVFVWKTSTGTSSVSVGDTLKIKGTIKKHETYHEVKQTILTRCVIISEESEKTVAS
jgi:hypothetical protein